MMFRQGAAEYNRFAPCLFDKKKYNIMMSAFLDMYGKVTDEEILKYFKLSNLVDGSIDTLDTYVKTYRR